MWIEDLMKAMWMLSDLRYISLIQRIEGNTIYMTNGTLYSISNLVDAYDERYGEVE